MSSGHLAVLVTTDTPDTTDLLDVVNFLQFVYGGGKPSVSVTEGAAGAAGAQSKSRTGCAESTVGVPQPGAPPPPPEPIPVVLFEKCGLGADGQPILDGQELATALLAAMEKAANAIPAAAANEALLSCVSPSVFAPTAFSPTGGLSPTGVSPTPGQAAPAAAAAGANVPPEGPTAIQRIVVVGCSSMGAAQAILASGLYAVAIVLTVNSVEAFPQNTKVQDAQNAKGAKKPEAKKPDPKKKGEVVKATGPANISSRLQTDFADATTSTQFVTLDVGNPGLAEAVMGDAAKVLKDTETRFTEYVTWVRTRQFAPLTPIPAAFELLEWTKLRATLDLAPVDVAATVCASATRLIGSRTDGWNMIGEVQTTLVEQPASRLEPVRRRTVQLIDKDAHRLQVQQREAFIAKVQLLRAEHEQLLESTQAAAGGKKAAEKPPPKSSKEGASPPPADGGISPIPEIPPPEPLPLVGFPFVVEEKPVPLEPTGEQDAKWIVRQFVKRSLGRLELESDAAKQLTALLASGDNKIDAPAVPSSAPPPRRETVQQSLLEASIRKLYGPVATPSVDADAPCGFEDFPARSKILYRATRAVPDLVLKETEPTIREAVLKKMEQALTSREKSFALLQTIADQSLRENFPESAVPLRAHQYVESINRETTNERLMQYVEHHGVDVTRVIRIDVADDLAKTHLAASQQVQQANAAVLIAAVDVPPSRQKTVDTDFHICGIPSYTDVMLWDKAPEGDVRKRAMAKHTFAGRSLTSPPIFASDSTKIVFPYDGSVVRAHDAPLSACRSVSYAKADLKASLHASIIPPEHAGSMAPGARRRFTTTFEDGVVYTASQPDYLPKPQSPAGHAAGLGGTLNGTQGATINPNLNGTNTSTVLKDQATPRLAAGDATSVAGTALTQLGTGTAQGTATVQGTVLGRTAAMTPMSGVVPPDGASGLPAASLAATSALSDAKLPFVFDPYIPSAVTISVAKNHFSVSAEESTGNVTYRFGHRDARRSIVAGLSATTPRTCVPSVEFEVSRTVDNFTGTVHRFFASGARQSLFADGAVATRLTDAAPWLLTSVDGTRRSQTDGVVIPGDSSDSRSKCAMDREASCRVRSRVDGVVVAEYFAPPRSESHPPLPLFLHTRVTAHADGTVIVTVLGTPPASSPVLDNLFSEMASLHSFGECTFVVESPRAPRLFLFAPIGPLNAFYVQLGDSSVLERHVMPPQTADQCSYMQTVFCRGSESTLRYNHDSALMFVEPHDVHLAASNDASTSKAQLNASMSTQTMQAYSKQRTTTTKADNHQSMNNIAICEAIAVFDLALGGMRLVDREKHVTTVTGIFDFSEPEITVSFQAMEVMELLLLMLPTGYQTHTRPKKLLDKLEEERRANTDEEDGPSGAFPSLIDRIRLMAQTFVIEHKLIQQESLRRPHNHPSHDDTAAAAKGASGTKAGASSTTTTAAVSASDDQRASTDLLARSTRPLVFAETGPDTYEHLMCAADLASFLKATSNKQWTVASSTCSGEPGVEQIAFYRAAGGTLLTPFEGSIIEPVSQTPWLPKSLQPPRRFVTPGTPGTALVGSPAAAHGAMPSGFAPPGPAPDFPLHGALRLLLRYTPLPHNARAAVVASHLESQVRYVKMNRYSKSLQDAIGTEDEATARGLELLWSRHGTKLSIVSAANLPPSPPQPADPRSADSLPSITQELSIPLNAHPPAMAPSIPMVTEHAITFLPEVVAFGPLVPLFAYHMPVTVRNNTSHTLLFEIYNPPPHDHFGAILPSFVTVSSKSFLLSPYGESNINILIALSPAALHFIASKGSANGGAFDEALRLYCHGIKSSFTLHIMGWVNTAANAKQALHTNVRIVGPARN